MRETIRVFSLVSWRLYCRVGTVILVWLVEQTVVMSTKYSPARLYIFRINLLDTTVVILMMLPAKAVVLFCSFGETDHMIGSRGNCCISK